MIAYSDSQASPTLRIDISAGSVANTWHGVHFLVLPNNYYKVTNDSTTGFEWIEWN
jgi:hypothetical protein